jgi:RHS repeat-associated protein
VTFKYDKDGNVVEMTDGTGTTTKEYDQLDRLTEVKNGAKEVVKYLYDLGNQQTEITYPNGKTVKRSFDKAGRMEKVADWLGWESTFTYNRDSQVKSSSFPGETSDSYAYNRADQLTEITNKKKAEVRGVVSYARDKLGQVEATVEPELETKYGYDSANRLTSANSTTLEYDKANDPTRIGSATYTYDKADQIATASTGTFEFNKLGQRVKETPTGESAVPYAYDQAGNLISTKSGGVESTFKYDGTGLLASETANATTYPLVWDVSSSLPLLLRSGDEYFIYGPEGRPIEQILTSTGTATFLHRDQLGSIQGLTNEVGEVTGIYGYGPTGSVVGHIGEDTVSLGFAGQYRMHTGKQLIYMRARILDPSTDQFLNPDPLSSSSGEPYGYAAANPVNRIDPTGLTSCQVSSSSSDSHDTGDDSNSSPLAKLGRWLGPVGRAAAVVGFTAAAVYFAPLWVPEVIIGALAIEVESAAAAAVEVATGSVIAGALSVSRTYLENGLNGEPVTQTDLIRNAANGIISEGINTNLMHFAGDVPKPLQFLHGEAVGKVIDQMTTPSPK